MRALVRARVHARLAQDRGQERNHAALAFRAGDVDHGVLDVRVPQRREESTTCVPGRTAVRARTPTTPRLAGRPCARGSAAARGTRPCPRARGCRPRLRRRAPRRRPADATKRTGRVGTFRRTRGGREARAPRLTARERARRATPRTSPRAGAETGSTLPLSPARAHGGPARAGLLGCAASAWQMDHTTTFGQSHRFFCRFGKSVCLVRFGSDPRASTEAAARPGDVGAVPGRRHRQ